MAWPHCHVGAAVFIGIGGITLWSAVTRSTLQHQDLAACKDASQEAASNVVIQKDENVTSASLHYRPSRPPPSLQLPPLILGVNL